MVVMNNVLLVLTDFSQFCSNALTIEMKNNTTQRFSIGKFMKNAKKFLSDEKEIFKNRKNMNQNSGLRRSISVQSRVYGFER